MSEIASLVRTAPKSFMHWWLGELGGLLPGRLTSKRRPVRPALILEIRKNGAELIEARAKGDKTLGRILGSIDDHGNLDGLAAIGERRYRQWPLIVRLEASLGMRKVIDLPFAARDDLANLLHFELDRLTPFSPEDVWFTWRILDADRAAGRISVNLEMAPKAIFAKAADMVAGFDRTIDRLEIEGGEQAEALNLLASTEKDDTDSRLKHLLPFLVLGLAIIAIWIPMNRQQNLIKQLEQELTTVKSSADETLKLREQLDTEAADAGFLTEAKTSSTPMTHILAELTALIPDHSYILQLEVDGEGIRLSGLADKASDLMSILDQSTMFASPEFRSAVTRDPRNGKERFQIAVELADNAS